MLLDGLQGTKRHLLGHLFQQSLATLFSKQSWGWEQTPTSLLCTDTVRMALDSVIGTWGNMEPEESWGLDLAKISQCLHRQPSPPLQPGLPSTSPPPPPPWLWLPASPTLPPF